MKLLRHNLRRLSQILWVLFRHGCAHLLSRRERVWPPLERWLPQIGLSGPVRLRVLLEDLGGTYIKFGQMLALQPDILSVETCNALFDLLDRVESFPYSEVERIWVEEIGRPPEEVFDSFEREPVATASVGQVHVAFLDGAKVAVKVQRPDAEFEFGSDIRLMVTMIAVIRRLRLKFLYWLIEPTTEFIAWTREELDYRFEARYSEQMRMNAAANPVQSVPPVFERYTTRRTLVVEYLEGVTLLKYLRAREDGNEVAIRRLEPAGFDRRQLAANVIDNFLGDAFRNGIYHADLHPANLIILPDNVVGYIDFGITGVISRHARRHLVAMTLALAEGDMDTLNIQFLEVSAYDPEADPRSFRAGLDRLAADWYLEEGGERRLAVNFTRIMGDMLVLSRQTGVLPERDIVKYIRSSIAIDGLVTRFEPVFDVGEYLVAACSRYLQWQGRRNRYAPERLLDFSAASGKLLRDGPRRANRLLERLAAGELPVRRDADSAEAGDEVGLRTRSLQLAGSILLVALLLSAGAPDSPALGLNLWTAQWLFLATAGSFLAVTLGKLSWSR
ncbi:MAG: AarF/ABC1/UbiB kinase family protein [bacterium]|nr:AarF/ABC1/UbiB kinase family protein [bacterium]